MGLFNFEKCKHAVLQLVPALTASFAPSCLKARHIAVSGPLGHSSQHPKHRHSVGTECSPWTLVSLLPHPSTRSWFGPSTCRGSEGEGSQHLGCHPLPLWLKFFHVETHVKPSQRRSAVPSACPALSSMSSKSRCWPRLLPHRHSSEPTLARAAFCPEGWHATKGNIKAMQFSPFFIKFHNQHV